MMTMTQKIENLLSVRRNKKMGVLELKSTTSEKKPLERLNNRFEQADNKSVIDNNYTNRKLAKQTEVNRASEMQDKTKCMIICVTGFPSKENERKKG